MILIYFSIFLIFNTFYFLTVSCLLDLREGTLAQCIVALFTLTYSEQVYVGMTVLIYSYFFLQQLHDICIWKNRLAVMPTYRHVCKFAILMHFFALTILYKNNACTFSVLMFLHDSEFLVHKLYNHGNCKRFIPGNTVRANTDFIFNLVIHFSFVVFVTWFALLLYSCGDVHPNPGPLSTASTSSNNSSSSGMSNILFSSLDLTHNLSFVHYNVQSIYSNVEILEAELFEFDILAFTETWLSPSTDTSELLLHSFNTPERKDREHDSHGGVMIYVKDCLHYKRRVELESRNIESIWIELTNNHKRILFGLFYRPPNSDSNYFSDIEDSVALAVDSPGIYVREIGCQLPVAVCLFNRQLANGS